MKPPKGTLIILGILVGTALIILAGHLRQTEVITDSFDIACHTEGEISQECDEVFTSVLHCAEEDGSDSWPNPCFWTNPDDGRLFYVIPDMPAEGAQNPAEQ